MTSVSEPVLTPHCLERADPVDWRVLSVVGAAKRASALAIIRVLKDLFGIFHSHVSSFSQGRHLSIAPTTLCQRHKLFRYEELTEWQGEYMLNSAVDKLLSQASSFACCVARIRRSLLEPNATDE